MRLHPLLRTRSAGLTSLGVALLICGCTQLQPHHYIQPENQAGAQAVDCTPDPNPNPDKKDEGWSVRDARCGPLLAEKTSDYDLYFAEFDDQGWPYRSPQDAGSAINYAIAGIHEAIGHNPGISIVTFVHGWKHSADYEDEDVKVVRKILTGLNHIESLEGRCKRRVVGVYVGWRGASLAVDPGLQDLSFWDRKDAAARVAQGSIREFFARIRAEQISGNQRRGQASANPCGSHPVRSMIVGHSFGGLIVYSVLSEALIRDIVDMQTVSAENSAELAGTGREGDLVLLVNPAIEATKFDALARASANIVGDWNRYHAPLFVSITSIDDLATRMAFPLGRELSTGFEAYTSEVATAQRSANLETLGQDPDYITMELDTLEYYNSSVAPQNQLAAARSCDGYEALSALPSTQISAAEKLRKHVELERETFREFRTALGPHPDATHVYPRQFCGDKTMVLFLVDPPGNGPGRTDPNAPVWNIRTRDPIVKSHGDITNPMLWQFVRQLYYDSGVYSR